MNGTGHLAESELIAGDFHTILIAGIDMYGRLFGRRIPVRRWKEVETDGIHVCTCVYAWDFAQELGTLHVDYAGDHTGWHDFRLLPDTRTLRRAMWLDGTAIVLADSVEEHSDELVPVAPRSILRHSARQLEARGYSALVATELEFHLYQGTPTQLRAADYRNLQPTTEVHADYNLLEGDLYEDFFRELRATLEGSGVPVEMAQVEYGHGQWEINLEHASPLEMADRHALFKHIVRYAAARSGMTATFMPRPLTEGMGSSCHVHLSLRDSSDLPVFHDSGAPHGASQQLLHAIGGVVDLAPQMLLWYAPTVNAMRRILTHDFAGNGLTWGYDNRTTTCRAITGAPATNRLEMRISGSDANPYLAISVVLASAKEGLDRAVDPGPPTTGNGYTSTSTVSLPRTLGEAATAFRDSSTARESFGDAVVEHYAALAEQEWSVFLTAVSDWDRNRYFDSI